VTEQVQLYGTLTGELPAVELPREEPMDDEPLPGGTNVLRLPDREERARRAGF